MKTNYFIYFTLKLCNNWWCELCFGESVLWCYRVMLMSMSFYVFKKVSQLTKTTTATEPGDETNSESNSLYLNFKIIIICMKMVELDSIESMHGWNEQKVWWIVRFLAYSMAGYESCLLFRKYSKIFTFCIYSLKNGCVYNSTSVTPAPSQSPPNLMYKFSIQNFHWIQIQRVPGGSLKFNYILKVVSFVYSLNLFTCFYIPDVRSISNQTTSIHAYIHRSALLKQGVCVYSVFPIQTTTQRWK